MGADVLTVSSKGQIVLPAAIRKALSIASGDKLAVFATDSAILLKPVSLPTAEEFAAELDKAEEWASASGLVEDDVDSAIAAVRSRKRI